MKSDMNDITTGQGAVARIRATFVSMVFDTDDQGRTTPSDKRHDAARPAHRPDAWPACGPGATRTAPAQPSGREAPDPSGAKVGRIGTNLFDIFSEIQAWNPHAMAPGPTNLFV